MADPKVTLEFRLRDLVTGPAKAVAQGVKGIGSAGRQALSELSAMGERFDATISGIQASLGKLQLARELKGQLVDPLVNAAADVEAAQKELAVNMAQGPDLSARLKTMSQAATATAGPTAFSEAQVMQLQAELLKRGMTESQAAMGATSAAQLATAEKSGGVDLSSAADSMSALVSTFGLSGDKLAQGADLISRAAAAGQVGPREITESLKNFSMGKTANVDMRDAMTTLAAISGKMSGGEAGTAMDAFLARAAVVDKKAGLGMYDQAGAFKGFEAAGAILAEKTAKMNDKQRLQFYQKTFGEGPAAALAAALAQADFGGTHGGMDSALSLTDKVTAMSDTFAGQVEAVGGSVESLKAVLGQPLLSPLKNLATQANDLVGRFSALAQEDPRLAKGIAGGAAGITAVAALAGLAQIPGGVATALKGLGGQAAGLGAGLAKGKAAEAAGVQPVYVVNYSEFGTSGGAPGAATGGKGGLLGTLGLAGAVAGAGSLAQQGLMSSLGAAADAQGGRLGGLLKLAEAGAANSLRFGGAGIGRLFADQSTLDQAAQVGGIDAIRAAIAQAWSGKAVEVKVTVDGDGVVTQQTALRSEAAAARTGAP